MENPINESGGARLVRDGVLAGVGEVYGLHVSPFAPEGMLLSRPGPILSNSDRFRVKIRSTGGHVAIPEKGSNAIDIATDIHVALRGFDRRFLSPLEPSVLVPALSNSGTSPNTRPGEADLWYSVRHYLPAEPREAFATAIRKRIEAVAGGYPDAKIEFEYVKGHPAVINDTALVEKASSLFKQSGLKVGEHPQDFAGDDLSYYLQKTPGAYWALGVRKEGAGGLHTAKFDMDEASMKYGILFWLVLATN
jgi:amidohydrolase